MSKQKSEESSGCAILLGLVLIVGLWHYIWTLSFIAAGIWLLYKCLPPLYKMDNVLQINAITVIYNLICVVLWIFMLIVSVNHLPEFWIVSVYGLIFVGTILNAISIYQSYKNNIKITGAVFGLVGNLLLLIFSLLFFPAIVLLIISIILLFNPKTKDRSITV